MSVLQCETYVNAGGNEKVKTAVGGAYRKRGGGGMAETEEEAWG